MNRSLKMPSAIKSIFWLTLLICCVCSCKEKEISGVRGSQEKTTTLEEETTLTGPDSINTKSPKGSDLINNLEEFEKLKKVISENLPNVEKQLQEALGSPVKLKMVVEDKTETAVSKVEINEKLKDVEGKLEEIQKNTD